MVIIKLSQVIWLLCSIQYSHCLRRIKGAQVHGDKKYAVYLVRKLPNGDANGWLCGGAIVSEWFIVTSAACVQDLQNAYAIAGYKKFVHANDIDNDECIKNTKKKIVLSCLPKAYTFDYEQVEEWTNIDIAVVKVESKYDFKDQSYLKHCSYIPEPIRINFDSRYQQPGIDAIAVGWGHSDKFLFKKPDVEGFNQKYIKFAPLLIVSKSVCKRAYRNYKKPINIDKYMICTDGPGSLDDMGRLINTERSIVDGCITKDQQSKGLRGNLCEDYVDPYDEVYQIDNKTRRDESDEEIIDEFSTSNIGVCQNDHGGPLVTWIGKHESLIGVVTTFILDSGSHCKGPYLFTSTQCNSEFLDCIINYEKRNRARRKMCESPQEIGFKIERRYWVDHPSGPAKSEVMERRRQIPIQQYHFNIRSSTIHDEDKLAKKPDERRLIN